MSLRKGKTKATLESSINAALLAVEIYNRPRTPFRIEGYITNMVIAWTRLFHAHFNQTIGEKYYYKKPNGHYKKIDGEKRSWELKNCISEYGNLPDAMIKNLLFFIKLRNKIEHRHIDRDEIGIMIFGEEFALNESLSFSLQFSRIRKQSQIDASKKLLSKEVKELKSFIENYRTNLSDKIFDTQEYSIKLIQIPKVSNTDRNDLAIEFVNWNSLSATDKKNYSKLVTIIKDKVVKKEAINPGKRKPGDVVNRVNSKINFKFNHYDHKCLYFCFKIRPTGSNNGSEAFETNIDYCHYDEVHDDYVYQDAWAELIINCINSSILTKEIWKNSFKNKISLNISEYEQSCQTSNC